MSVGQESINEASSAASGTVSRSESLSAGVCRPIASNWCHSTSQLVKVDFEWTINHVVRYEITKSGVVIKSASFSAEETPDYKWKLQLQFPPYSQTGIVVSLLSANPVSSSRIPIAARVKIAIVNKMREKVLQKEIHVPRSSDLPYTLTTFHLVDDKDKDEHLVFYCEIENWISKGLISGRTENFREQPVFSCDDLVKNFGELFETMKFSDVTFNIRGSKFKAHKAILSARSQVFAAMFDHETLENLRHQVNIQDIDPEVFQEMLRFVYIGRVAQIKMKTLSTRLLVAAGKYLLGSLLTACEKYLVNEISAENCIEFLLLADGHSADYLKRNALDFFRHFPNEVMATKGWKKAKREHSTWLCVIQQAAFTSIRSST